MEYSKKDLRCLKSAYFMFRRSVDYWSVIELSEFLIHSYGATVYVDSINIKGDCFHV